MNQERIQELAAQIASIKHELEELKAQPSIAEGWINIYETTSMLHRDESRARGHATPDALRVAVHLREVLPWKRWQAIGGIVYANGESLTGYIARGADRIVDAHNAEMERITGTKGEE